MTLAEQALAYPSGPESSRSARAYARPTRLLLAVLLIGLVLGCAPLAAAESAPKVQAVALFKNKAVLLINGKRRVVKAGETTPEGITLQSANAERAQISYQGETRKLALDGRISAEFSGGASQQVIRLIPGRNGHYFADGQINGNAVRFLVDTGASGVAINRRTAKRIGLQYRVVGEPTRVATASGIANAYSVVFDEVKVSALGLRNVAGVVLDSDPLDAALLGQSFLNRLDIHREGQVLELRAR